MTMIAGKSDNEWIQMIRGGDETALDVLLTGYKDLVLKKTSNMYLLGGERDDLIQEGMIGLLNAVRTYETAGDASFAHYADICITRKMLTAIESSNRQKQIPLNSYVSLFQGQEDDTDLPLVETLENREGKNPEELLIDLENVQTIEERIEKELSGFEQDVLRLMLTGMEYTQIAEVLGKTAKQIDNAIQRIRKKLRE